MLPSKMPARRGWLRFPACLASAAALHMLVMSRFLKAVMANPQHEGVLEQHPKGYAFLRSAGRNYVPQTNDPYVPGPLIHKFRLREGLLVSGPLENARRGSGPRLGLIDRIEGM